MIEVYNTIGEKIYTTTYINQQTPSKINLSDYKKGVYFVCVYTENEAYTQKVVIQ